MALFYPFKSAKKDKIREYPIFIQPPSQRLRLISFCIHYSAIFSTIYNYLNLFTSESLQMSELSSSNEQNWFENVENFRPLRGGRRAGTLNEVATSTTKITVDDAERKFLKEFAETSTKEDPLELMCKYASWFEEHFPSGKQKYFYPILYKICTTFCIMDIYKNDERLMKLWLKLAENFPESGLAVMEFAFAKGSCRQLAKFYVSWSDMYQSIGWWNKAREKLQLGIKMCATPLDLLHRASDELESCVMRTTCQADESQYDEIEFTNNLEMTRETLGRLRGIGQRHFAPILRHPQGPPGKLLSKTPKANADKFEIFTEEPQSSCNDYKTPMIPRIDKKRSRVAESLAEDLDYQTLFGAIVSQEKVDLQITNEENQLRAASCKLPDMPASTPIEHVFNIYQDEQQESNKPECNGKKAKLKLRKELIKEMSIEEAMAKRILTSLSSH